MASIAWSTSDAILTTTGLMKRIVPTAKNLAVNSTLADLTLPFFTVHFIHWFSDADMAANRVADLLLAIDRDRGSNNISDPVNPLTSIAPTLGFLPSTPYQPPYNNVTQEYEFPLPTKVVAQTGLIALYWDRVLNPPENRTSCPQSSVAFGPLPPHVDFRSNLASYAKGEGNATFTGNNCYIFANVTYSAGVAACKNCVLTASGGIFQRNVYDLVPTINSISEADTSLKPDAMTHQAILMTLEVITTMALMNVSIPSTWNNLNG